MALSTINIEKSGIDIELRGSRQILSLRKHIILESNQILNMEIASNLNKPRFYKKMAGTNAWYYGGWFRENGENEFWDVRNFSYVLVITTQNFKYKKIFIEVGRDFQL